MDIEYSILDRKCKHLSIKDRCQIQACLELGVSDLEIDQNREQKKNSESHKHTKLRLQEISIYVCNKLKFRRPLKIISNKFFAEKMDETFAHQHLHVYKKHRPEYRNS